ncbi:MAG: serine protease [Lachnospiraceae bacterium]|nr:serine protease [Lachnospiraceae bacterium]
MKNKVLSIIRAILITLCMLTAAFMIKSPITARAASKLSVSDIKLWVNGTGTVKVTYKGHTDEKLKVGKAIKKYATVTVGDWDGDTAIITIEAKADKNVKLSITVGDEKATVKLYLLKLEERRAEDIYLMLKDAMVEIECLDSKGNVYIGSGFFIGKGLVLTNEHVVDCASSITITDYYGVEHPIKRIRGVSKEKDLILIEVSGANKGALSIADSVSGGERIYNIGSPAGLTGSFVTGIAANEGYLIEDTHYIQFSMPTGIGAGGGPIVNAKGQVLGVMTLVVNAAQNITMAVDFTEIKPFLASLKAKDRMSLEDYYKTTSGKEKASNDYHIFEGLSDENTTKTYSGLLDELTREELYQLAYNACVDIVIKYDKFGNGASGSGFFINNNTIITNHHVIGKSAPLEISITDYNGNEYVLDGGWSAVRSNATYDVAVVTVVPKEEGTKHGILETAAGYVPAVGETVYGMGSPAGYKCTFSEGIVIMSTRKYSGEGINMDFINMSVPITGGSSGGPLINKYGQVIGINSRIINVTGNSNLAVPIKYVSEAAG